jgi:flagellar biosynthesis repressor protein FlbT
MALRISLKPRERVILGAAVIRNGTVRTTLTVENQVPVLRESDIMPPSAMNTPCERIYMAIQLLYVAPESEATTLETYRSLVADVLRAAPSAHPMVEAMDALVGEQQYYQALKAARALLAHERRLLSHVH